MQACNASFLLASAKYIQKITTRQRNRINSFSFQAALRCSTGRLAGCVHMGGLWPTAGA